MERSTAKRNTPIESTRNSFSILEELKERESAGVTELARATGISKSTVHNHLSTLRNLGYVKQVDGEYRLGFSLLSFGGSTRKRSELYRHAHDEINDLAEETGETAKVVVEENGRGVYLYQSYGVNAVHTDTYAGMIVYLHSTAVGKAILAHTPVEQIDDIIERHGLPPATEQTITDREALLAELETIRERGVAYDDEERIEGMRCVAAPVLRDGAILGAISITGPKKRIKDDRFRNQLPDQLLETARIIELSSTYAGNSD